MLGFTKQENVVFVLLFLVVTSGTYWLLTLMNPKQTPAFTENERAAFTAGMVVGLDISLALKGQPALDRDSWMKLAEGFDKETRDCKDMDCVMQRIMTVREDIRQKMQPHTPEVFR